MIMKIYILFTIFFCSIFTACKDTDDSITSGAENEIENWIPDTFVGNLSTANANVNTRLTIDGAYPNYSAKWEDQDMLGLRTLSTGNIVNSSGQGVNNAVLNIYQGSGSSSGAFMFDQEYKFNSSGPSTTSGIYKLYYPYKKGVADYFNKTENSEGLRLDTVPEVQLGNEKIYTFASGQATYDAENKKIPFKMQHDVAYLNVNLTLATDVTDDHLLKTTKIKKITIRNLNNAGHIAGIFTTDFAGNTTSKNTGFSSVTRVFETEKAVPTYSDVRPTPVLTANFTILPIAKKDIPSLVVECYDKDDKVLFSRSITIDAQIEKNKVYNINVLVKRYRTLNIFVPGVNLTRTDQRRCADGASYNLATGEIMATNVYPVGTYGDRNNMRYSDCAPSIFENPEYFGRYATFTSPVGDCDGVRWWTAYNVSDITEANLKARKIDLIWYSSEHLVNVGYQKLLTKSVAQEIYNYHKNNSNVGMFIISGERISYGPTPSKLNSLIEMYFGSNDDCAISYNGTAGGADQILFTSTVEAANSKVAGVGNFIFRNGIFAATGTGTLDYGPIPEDRKLRWVDTVDAEDCTYHDAAYSGHIMVDKLNENWIPLFYGQKNENNGSNLANAIKDENKAVLAYNPKERIMWTPGASQWGWSYGGQYVNCSVPYTSPFNPANSDFNSVTGGVLTPWLTRNGLTVEPGSWLSKVKPVYIMPLNGQNSDNTNWGKVKRYGSRVMYGCIADMIIRNNMGQE